mmetsp:Transcript_5894/g.14022  ORF Transcript_5894/g.14022 Transcript_5894/m.14022 type:complete len:215 (-) Transcript_5894:7153-7797(-)
MDAAEPVSTACGPSLVSTSDSIFLQQCADQRQSPESRIHERHTPFHSKRLQDGFPSSPFLCPPRLFSRTCAAALCIPQFLCGRGRKRHGDGCLFDQQVVCLCHSGPATPASLRSCARTRSPATAFSSARAVVSDGPCVHSPQTCPSRSRLHGETRRKRWVSRHNPNPREDGSGRFPFPNGRLRGTGFARRGQTEKDKYLVSVDAPSPERSHHSL